MNNKYVIRKNLRSLTLLFVLPFSLAVLCSGCEPFRKKFVRKQKRGNAREVLPVLNPIEYPRRMDTPDTLYRHYYSLWQVWHKDFVVAMDEKAGTKKLVYLLDQLIVQLDGMQGLLQEREAEIIGRHEKQLFVFREELGQPESLRNNYGIKSSVVAIAKDIRRNFKYGQVKDRFK